MNQEIRAYVRLEARVSGAFSFFINGMVAALIYHKADTVPFDAAGIAVDLLVTCVVMVTLTAYFARASLRRTGTSGIFKSDSRFLRTTSLLFSRRFLFGPLAGILVAVLCFLLIAPVPVLLHVERISFGAYMVFKTGFTAVLGYSLTRLELYAGMNRIG